MDSYRKLDAWQRAHMLCIGTLRAADAASSPRTYALFDQLRRATISVEANIVEGYALQTPGLFRRHVRIALGSAAEVECLLNVAGELEYLPRPTLADLQADAGRTIALLFGLLRMLGTEV